MKKLDYVEVGGILYPDLHVNVKEFGHFGTKKDGIHEDVSSR